MKREGFLRATLVGVAALCGLGVAKKAAVLSDPTPHIQNTMPTGGWDEWSRRYERSVISKKDFWAVHYEGRDIALIRRPESGDETAQIKLAEELATRYPRATIEWVRI